MKVVIAPQAFKGSLSAQEAALAIAQGVRRIWPEAETALAPVADGGDGTLEVLVEATGGRYLNARVSGPLEEPVQARWGVLGDGATAVIETARACGIVLVPPERRDPSTTTTRGVGDLLSHALEQGYRRFILGLGGSATNDGGAGMAQALGVSLLDTQGDELPPGGISLTDLSHIDISNRDPRISESEIIVAMDVSNPLCGPQGAAATYGPQKGATPGMVTLLDQALARLAEVVLRDVGLEIREMAGAGAAGGLGAGLVAFLGARLRSGADLVCETVKFEEQLEGANLVIVGEGSLDWQTAFDKAPVAVARRARSRGIPVLAVAGSLGPGHQELREHGINEMAAIMTPGMSLEEALANATGLLTKATERALQRSRLGLREGQGN